MIKWYSRKGFLSVDTGNCYLNPLLDCLLTYMIGTYIPTCIWSFLHEDNLHLCEILVVSGHGLWTIVIVLKAFQFDSCNQWELCTFLYFFFQTHHSLHESGIASDLSYLHWRILTQKHQLMPAQSIGRHQLRQIKYVLPWNSDLKKWDLNIMDVKMSDEQVFTKITFWLSFINR